MRDTDHKSPPRWNATTQPGNLPTFPSGWTPLHAWRLHALYAPVVHALAALFAPTTDSKAPARPRILQVGGHSGVLAALLAQADGGPVECDVNMHPAKRIAGDEPKMHAYDCVVAIDWLSALPASRRQQELAALCRTVRAGIVLIDPFDTPAANAAQRAVNDGYRSAHGMDHPTLGRLIEFGLPDLPTTLGWIEAFFANVQTRPIEHVGLWQMAASMAILEPELQGEPTAADIAAAALYPLPHQLLAAEPSYRMLVVAAARPFALATQPPSIPSAARNEFPALTMLAALEAGEQRRTLASLVDAVTSEREREREEFRAGVASLAAELRDLEARTDALAREARERERTIANLQAMLGAAEARAGSEVEHAELSDTHARNLEALLAGAEGRADAAHTHARNLDSMRVDAERRAAAAAARADAAETHARNLSAMRADAEARAEAAAALAREVQSLVADAEARASATALHVRNLDSLRADAERRAGAAAARVEAAETHARNLDALRADAERRAGAAAARAEATETHARNVDALRAAAEARAEAAAARARNLQQAHETFLRSRAGRAYASYVRMKGALTGRK